MKQTGSNGGVDRRHVVAVGAGLMTLATLAACGGGGSEATSAGCFGQALEPRTGARYVASYVSVLGPAPIDAGQRTLDITVTGPVTFQSRAAIEVHTVESNAISSHIMAARFQTDTDRLAYFSGSGPTFAQLGTVSRIQSRSTIQGMTGAIEQRVTELEPVPWRDPAWSLARGASGVQAHDVQVSIETLSSTGSAVQPGSVTTNWNRAVTWVGSERITVAAGTFEACRFEYRDLASGGSTTQWLLPGHGLLLRWVSADRSEEATRIEIDGRVL